MTAPAPDVEVDIPIDVARMLLDGDSCILVDVDEIGGPYTVFAVRYEDVEEMFFVESVAAMHLNDLLCIHSKAGFDTRGDFLKSILKSHPKIAKTSILFCHRVSKCRCSNCRKSCDNYEPESMCELWKGGLI